MKAFVNAVLVGLFLVPSAQAATAKRVLNDQESKQLSRALELSPNNGFACAWRDEHGNKSNYQVYLDRALDNMDRYVGSFTQYDSPTPLIQFVGRDSSTGGYQLSLYTNSSYTEVTQMVMTYFQRRDVNRGNLAKPNVVKEDVVTETYNCKKIEENKK